MSLFGSNMNILSKELIKNLQLTPSQSDVYLAALELGQASMQDLARKSGVKRTTIYKFIEELKERQVILETKRGPRSVYSAAPPEQLMDREKNRLSELDRLLPQLNALHNIAREKPRVLFYEGIEAVKQVYADTLKEKKPIVSWSDLAYTKSALGKFIEDYPAQRARQNVPLRWIIPDTAEAREFIKRDYGLLRETKLLPNAKFEIDINIYGRKVLLTNASSPNPFAVLIEDEKIANTLREAWQQLWDRIP